MAITVGNGNAVASNGAVSSIATSGFNTIAGGRIVVIVVLLDNTISVSTLVDDSGSATYSLIAAYNISATLRLEYWRSDNPALKSGCIITATPSADVACAIAANQYTGEVGIITGTVTQAGNNKRPFGSKAMAYSTDYILALVGFNGASGDTISSSVGTRRQYAVGAAGAAGVALVDITQDGVVDLYAAVALNNDREWGTIMMGLQATTTPYPYYIGGPAFLFGAFQPGNAGFDPVVIGTMPTIAEYTIPSLHLSPNALPNGNVGVVYSQPIIMSGGSVPYTYEIFSGTLPDGLTLDEDTGIISGTPTTLEMQGFVLRGTDNAGRTVDKSYSILITTNPTDPGEIGLSPMSFATGYLGESYNQLILAFGGTEPYTYEVLSGSLPTGLSLDEDTGEITGTPTVVGVYTFVIRATDSAVIPLHIDRAYWIEVISSTSVGIGELNYTT